MYARDCNYDDQEEAEVKEGVVKCGPPPDNLRFLWKIACKDVHMRITYSPEIWIDWKEKVQENEACFTADEFSKALVNAEKVLPEDIVEWINTGTPVLDKHQKAIEFKYIDVY